jgi:hypothetical protein
MLITALSFKIPHFDWRQRSTRQQLPLVSQKNKKTARALSAQSGFYTLINPFSINTLPSKNQSSKTEFNPHKSNACRGSGSRVLM